MHGIKQPRAKTFRADEAAAEGRDYAINHYSMAFKKPEEREAAAAYMDGLIEKYGPVVNGYPSWHPFTAPPAGSNQKRILPHTQPQGFEGLDHTICFRHAFITAPYGGAEHVVDSAWKKKNPYIEPEALEDVLLYNYGTTPVLVTCNEIPKEEDGTIQKRFALGSMLSTELPEWVHAECGETWETMRRYILGNPCGTRSSLFVNEDTGQSLREVFNLLNHHGLFGPIHE